MAAKTAHDAARAKAAKQKKLLLALAPVLLLALFFAYHTMSKRNGSQAPPPPAAAPPAATPVSATTPSPSPTFTPLATPPADTGKLNGLAQFAPKDPFHDQGPHGTGSATNAGSSPKQTTKQQKAPPAPPPAAALIAVNGHVGVVTLGATFPTTKNAATNAVFRLVGLTAKSAKVAVVGGSYSNGARTLELTVNTVVTLVNTADGKRYTLILYPQAALSDYSQTTTPPATTTTTTTTTTTGP